MSQLYQERGRFLLYRYEVGSEDGHFHDCPKMLFRQNYFEVLDFVVNCVRQRFNQPGYAVYKHLVDLLLKAARCETYNTEYDFIVQFYGTDLDKFNLKIQLDLLATQFKHSG